MGRIVIVAYRPKPGKRAELAALVAKHVDILRREGLVTDRPASVMRAKDGTLVEMFEWRSPEAIQGAHTNPAVLALWAEFDAACEFVPLERLAEAKEMFAEFDAV